jgi:hypothetical protein
MVIHVGPLFIRGWGKFYQLIACWSKERKICEGLACIFVTVHREIAEPRREPVGLRLVVAADRRLQQKRS